MITTDKVTEIFCILDEFCKNLDAVETFLSECLSQTGVALGLYVDALGAITRGNVWRGEGVVNKGFVK